MIYTTQTIPIRTTKENQMIDITYDIEKLLGESKVKNGRVILFVPHTTAAVTINENADPDVKTDFLYGMNKIYPKDASYVHYEGNSHSHIKSSVIGVSETILVENYSMILGTWQGVYFIEFDGPRNRKLVVRIEGEC